MTEASDTINDYDLRRFVRKLKALEAADEHVHRVIEAHPLAKSSEPYPATPGASIFTARRSTSEANQRIDLTLRVADWLVE